jgi:hypothetical protein
MEAVRGREVLALALIASALGVGMRTAPPSDAFRGSKVYVAANADSGSPRYRPKRFWLSGDATLLATKVRWRSYNGAIARARALGHVNDCDPDCADGHFVSHRMALRLSRPRKICGRYVYSRVRITWAGHPPLGSRKRFSLNPNLHCP